MKPRPFRLVFVVFALCLSCNTPTPTAKNEEKAALLVSDTYKPPVFENDLRIEKIREVAPKIKELFEKHAQAHHIPGIAYGIVVDDSLVFASASGILDIGNKTPATVHSAFRIASMSKSFTAMAILKLRDEGLLSLNDPVSKYIPEMGQLRYLSDDSPVMDIENLLNMTTGFPEDNPWGDRQLAISDRALLDLVSGGLSLSNNPSLEYEYSNTGYALLGEIITKVSGMPYQGYMVKHILQPLGMHHTYWEYGDVPKEHLALGYRWEDGRWGTEPMLHDGAYGAMGGLITSITDFSKYVSFHLSAWPARNGEDLGPVKRSTLREMHTPQFSYLNASSTDWNNEICPTIRGYGYGLGISENCKKIMRVTHGGALPGFGSNYAFFPEYGIGIMAFGNLTYTGPVPYNEIEKLLFETLELQPRKLPVSDILAQRKGEILQWIQGDENRENEIFAENFFMDWSKTKRQKDIRKILDEAGTLGEVQELRPHNQLRANFTIKAEKGEVDLFFTLTPEKEPKVQQLDVEFKPSTAQ